MCTSELVGRGRFSLPLLATSVSRLRNTRANAACAPLLRQANRKPHHQSDYAKYDTEQHEQERPPLEPQVRSMRRTQGVEFGAQRLGYGGLVARALAGLGGGLPVGDLGRMLGRRRGGEH